MAERKYYQAVDNILANHLVTANIRAFGRCLGLKDNTIEEFEKRSNITLSGQAEVCHNVFQAYGQLKGHVDLCQVIEALQYIQRIDIAENILHVIADIIADNLHDNNELKQLADQMKWPQMSFERVNWGTYIKSQINKNRQDSISVQILADKLKNGLNAIRRQDIQRQFSKMIVPS